MSYEISSQVQSNAQQVAQFRDQALTNAWQDIPLVTLTIPVAGTYLVVYGASGIAGNAVPTTVEIRLVDQANTVLGPTSRVVVGGNFSAKYPNGRGSASYAGYFAFSAGDVIRVQAIESTGQNAGNSLISRGSLAMHRVA